ncbi:S10 family peptidase [Pseudobacteriovorax antillogorgiicola]|uniref:Carboxypeptidase C (Cathepsin A) n=1 Tax=Pseudobacteriovorax antillogorgiicola TaxID=1513793 RepID=A0A1Y6BFM0_9BACT|nr:peptidase S10 [Pseudobacteriovorax antillogorgiicola]TCS56220.1 carboxypeptidase C (cathepsin A) [Pseudobacteriovorax antillogorgiicola]SMF08393.1 Carboxypeptidase C (cathepsin A) [Pseudobacteriovorax antillogorgiicola]
MIKVAILGLLIAGGAIAETKKDSSEKEKEIPKPLLAKTEHEGRFGKVRMKYRAKAGETYLYDREGKPKASIFSTAYTALDIDDPAKRPVTFIFNGGPGSSSVWLHMGVMGPMVTRVPSDGAGAGAAPYKVESNPWSLLVASDLVFIDPVGTGYSRALGKYEDKQFWGVREDAEVIGEFIRSYISSEKRWNSPKYLAGESYGTVRAAALVRELQEGWEGIALNGVMLISAILDFQAGRFQKGNDTPFVTFLPTYAATAWYHKKVPEHDRPLEEFLADVRDFASTDYVVALFKGNNLSVADRQKVLDQLHRFTGLDKAYLEQTNLRIHAFRFMKELLRDQGKTIGRFDSRYLGKDYDAAGEFFDYDASAYGITGAYVASINHYLGHTLQLKTDRKYLILNGEVGSSWNWGQAKGQKTATGYLNLTPTLATGMIQNPDFRIFVANGYYDLATPFHSTEYTLAHHGIDPKRVTMQYYEAGHMMYVHQPSLEALGRDLMEFVSSHKKTGRVAH